ncbi:MAG: uroporphyrinogen decarboxylase [Vicinamibacterales bacterium]
MVEYLGWAATTVFVGSYFFTRAETLRRLQMLGALMWVAYGLLIEASPVVAANLLVFGAAAWTLTRSTGRADTTLD